MAAERAGGDTKTPESRRTLALPRKCVEALREHRVRQADRLAAGPLWRDHGLVFASAVGRPMDDHNVRRMFRAITEDAGLGTGWVPREMRHTFVSLLSARGVPVEAIAMMAGHNQTATTELVYRHQIVPAQRAAPRSWTRSSVNRSDLLGDMPSRPQAPVRCSRRCRNTAIIASDCLLLRLRLRAGCRGVACRAKCRARCRCW